jgi:hypothetical protein
MGRLFHPRAGSRSFDAELSDPALAYLFGPGLDRLPAPVTSAPRLASRGGAWLLARDFLAEDETLVRMDDGGLLQIREVPDGADFEITVDEGIDFASPLACVDTNLDYFREEFEADLAVFEGRRAARISPDRPR